MRSANSLDVAEFLWTKLGDSHAPSFATGDVHLPGALALKDSKQFKALLLYPVKPDLDL